jgi:ankyrin repeat protein
VHAGYVEPIFEAVLANDPSRITPAAAARRMDEDLLITDVHWLYRGDTPLHLAAAGLRYDAVRAAVVGDQHLAAQQRIIELLVSAGATVDLPDRGGVTPLHRAVAPTGAGGTAGTGELQLEIVRMLLAAGATLADVDHHGVAVADRIQSPALRSALAAERPST